MLFLVYAFDDEKLTLERKDSSDYCKTLQDQFDKYGCRLYKKIGEKHFFVRDVEGESDDENAMALLAVAKSLEPSWISDYFLVSYYVETDDETGEILESSCLMTGRELMPVEDENLFSPMSEEVRKLSRGILSGRIEKREKAHGGNLSQNRLFMIYLHALSLAKRFSYFNNPYTLLYGYAVMADYSESFLRAYYYKWAPHDVFKEFDDIRNWFYKKGTDPSTVRVLLSTGLYNMSFRNNKGFVELRKTSEKVRNGEFKSSEELLEFVASSCVKKRDTFFTALCSRTINEVDVHALDIQKLIDWRKKRTEDITKKQDELWLRCRKMHKWECRNSFLNESVEILINGGDAEDVSQAFDCLIIRQDIRIFDWQLFSGDDPEPEREERKLMADTHALYRVLCDRENALSKGLVPQDIDDEALIRYARKYDYASHKPYYDDIDEKDFEKKTALILIFWATGHAEQVIKMIKKQGFPRNQGKFSENFKAFTERRLEAYPYPNEELLEIRKIYDCKPKDLMFGAREVAILENSEAWHNGNMKADAITAYLEYIKDLEEDIRDIGKGRSDKPLIPTVAELIEACAELASGAEANGGARLKTARKHSAKALKLMDKYREGLDKFYLETADETGPFWHRCVKNREQEMKDLLKRVEALLGE